MFFKISQFLVHACGYVTITGYCIYVCSCQRVKLRWQRQMVTNIPYHQIATENLSSTFDAHVNYSSPQNILLPKNSIHRAQPRKAQLTKETHSSWRVNITQQHISPILHAQHHLCFCSRTAFIKQSPVKHSTTYRQRVHFTA